MNICKRLLSTSVWATALLAAATIFAAVPPPEKLLPDDTLVVFTAPDFAKLQDIFKKAPQWQLWKDPSMQAFKEKLTTKWDNDIVKPLEEDLGIKFEDYTTLLQGQVTIAITQDGWAGHEDQEPGVLILVDVKDKSDQLKKNLADVRKKWTDSGRSLRTEKVRDVDFSIVQLSTNDVPKTLREMFPKSSPVQEVGDEKPEKKTEDKNELVIGQAQSLLIMGSTLKSVEKVMARVQQGSAPVLAEVPAFQANYTALFRDSSFYAWVNVKRFMDILVPIWSVKKDNPDAPNPFDLPVDKILTALGLTAVKSIALAFQPSADGSQMQLFCSVPESSRQGIFKILAGEKKETLPPAFVPADVIKFQRWRIDGRKAWATLEKTLTDISPQAISGLNFIIEMANTSAKEKDSSFDIRKNLIGNLGDDVVSYQKAAKGQSLAELASPPSLILVGSPNPEQLAGSLKSLLVFASQQSGAAPEEREFLGRKINSVSVNIPGMAGGMGGKPPTLSYAATSGYVAFSTDATMIEEYLRTCDSQPKSLREVAGLSDATQKVIGPSSTLFGYQNDGEAVRNAIELLKATFGSSAKSSPNPLSPFGAGMPGFEKLKDWFDFSLLPPYEKISKYFGFTVYSGNATVDGLSLKAYSPVPPALKR